MTTLQSTLEHAVTAHDLKGSKRRGYNPYALGVYLQAIDRAMVDLAKHNDLRRALCDNFNDRLLACVLKAANLPAPSVGEIRGQGANS